MKAAAERRRQTWLAGTESQEYLDCCMSSLKAVHCFSENRRQSCSSDVIAENGQLQTSSWLLFLKLQATWVALEQSWEGAIAKVQFWKMKKVMRAQQQTKQRWRKRLVFDALSCSWSLMAHSATSSQCEAASFHSWTWRHRPRRLATRSENLLFVGPGVLGLQFYLWTNLNLLFTMRKESVWEPNSAESYTRGFDRSRTGTFELQVALLIRSCTGSGCNTVQTRRRFRRK